MDRTQNPFPGMNPFFERACSSFHAKLIGFIDDAIGESLPADLITRPEERIVIDESDPPASYRADVAIAEDKWKADLSPAWQSAVTRGGTAALEPQLVLVEEHPERWIEIRTADGTLVTVIELLSPTNKQGGWEAYRSKQRQILESTANLVEIDLLRAGRHVLAVPQAKIRERAPGTCYHICVSRACKPFTREVYSCPFREPMPIFRIPLRETDDDLVLNLQPLIDRCYTAGRYYLSRFDDALDPPFEGEEAQWIEARLQAAGLR